jgi:2-hydroxymuconate-semialdehyde hydrolase
MRSHQIRHMRFRNGLSGVLAGEEGLPLILLHPIGLSCQTWRHVQPALAGAFRTLALDLLGFGKSRKPHDGDYSLQAQGEHVLAVTEELGWDQVDLVGNSLGGAVAMAAAITAPERIASLALVGTVAYPGGMPPLGLFAQLPLAEHPLRLTSRLAALGAIGYCFANPRRLERDAVRTYAGVLSSRDGVRAFRLTGQALFGASLTALAHGYRDLRTPALVIHGDRDPIIPRWVPERLSSELPKAELRWLTHVGHFPQEEDPAQLVDLLCPFLLNRDRAVA